VEGEEMPILEQGATKNPDFGTVTGGKKIVILVQVLRKYSS